MPKFTTSHVFMPSIEKTDDYVIQTYIQHSLQILMTNWSVTILWHQSPKHLECTTQLPAIRTICLSSKFVSLLVITSRSNKIRPNYRNLRPPSDQCKHSFETEQKKAISHPTHSRSSSGDPHVSSIAAHRGSRACHR